MRPRKQILLWSESEAVGQEYRFLLLHRGPYAVDHYSDVDEFTAAMADSALDYELVVLVAGEDQDQLAALSVLSARRLIHIPTLIVMLQQARRRVDFLAERVLHFPVAADQLLEAVATLCARKRGPKKLLRPTTQELVGS